MAESPKEPEPDTGFDIASAERVGEDNWESLRAEGFRAHTTLSQEQMDRLDRIPTSRSPVYLLMKQFGINHVLTGDAFDLESDRPLRHMPGMTIYVRGEPIADPSQSGKARA
jgi:hypothetical protein